MLRGLPFVDIRLLSCIASLVIAGCVDDTASVADPVTDGAPSDGGGPGDDAEPPDVEPIDVAAPDVHPPDAADPNDDCTALRWRGQILDCRAVDLCCGDIGHRVACCECAPEFCPGEDDCDLPCPDDDEPDPPGESCMACHNGSRADDYSGPGLLNPHPFPDAEAIPCTGCHGGDGQGAGRLGSHVPPPPAIGDRNQQIADPRADFNRRTLAGIDRLEPAVYAGEDGVEHSTLDYLQFINPGDLRVVAAGRGCGDAECHAGAHADWLPRSIHATSTGIFSGTRFKVGLPNRIAEYRGDVASNDSLADTAPRAIGNPAFDPNDAAIGEVGRLVELPVVSHPGGVLESPDYRAAQLAAAGLDPDVEAPNRMAAGSALEALFDAQMDLSCAQCHLFGAGRNDRYGDFRSSGCTACHMEYGLDGRYDGPDPNIPAEEPVDPDGMAPGERSHAITHQIRNVAKILPSGAFLAGISDRACVGCHQGGNRTVLQYWGVRPDENADLTTGQQYPAMPADFVDTTNDSRLYNPAIENVTFNGRTARQHILTEDYDGDGRDDTPPDVHYERGLGCIDCHGSRDLHGATAGDAAGGIFSRQDQTTAIRCASCHGALDAYAETAPCTTYTDEAAECAVDAAGNPLRHVTVDAQGHYWLRSRLDGQLHYVSQTRDVATPTGRAHPLTLAPLFSPAASFAMGRADGDAQTGIGPVQRDPARVADGFSHLDTLDCAACHAAWTNTCIGCHLASAFDAQGAGFSWTTGAPSALMRTAEDLVYSSPVMQTLGVDSRGRITKMTPAPKMFWRYTDDQGDTTPVFAFGDRLGEGRNPARNGRGDFPALGFNPMMAHSIRGRVTPESEGPSYCVACHLNEAMMADDARVAAYDAFAAAYDNQRFADLDFGRLAVEIGQNPGNRLNSPFFVRMMAGLGTGLYLFDADGCPVNPLDDDASRAGCDGRSPAARFPGAQVAFDLDRVVEAGGVPNASGAHPRLTADGARRDGATNPGMAGPLGGATLQRLIGGGDLRRGLVLDAWLDADGQPQGEAVNIIE